MSYEKQEKPNLCTNWTQANNHTESNELAEEEIPLSVPNLYQWAFDSMSEIQLPNPMEEAEVSQAQGPPEEELEAKPKRPPLTKEQAQIQSHLLVEKVFTQNKNTPRLHVRTALKYLPLQKFLEAPQLKGKVEKMCRFREKWHLQSKNHVFLLSHLQELIGESKLTKKESQLVRKAFSFILKAHTLDMLGEPKSQIKKHRIDYLRTSKVEIHRCRHPDLIKRNESR